MSKETEFLIFSEAVAMIAEKNHQTQSDGVKEIKSKYENILCDFNYCIDHKYMEMLGIQMSFYRIDVFCFYRT